MAKTPISRWGCRDLISSLNMQTWDFMILSCDPIRNSICSILLRITSQNLEDLPQDIEMWSLSLEVPHIWKKKQNNDMPDVLSQPTLPLFTCIYFYSYSTGISHIIFTAWTHYIISFPSTDVYSDISSAINWGISLWQVSNPCNGHRAGAFGEPKYSGNIN